MLCIYVIYTYSAHIQTALKPKIDTRYDPQWFVLPALV